MQKKNCGTIAVLIALALALLLDSPAGRPFNGSSMGTEMLGSYYFESLQKTLGLPGVSLSLFELVSLGILLRVAVKDRRHERQPMSVVAVFLLLLFPFLVLCGSIAGVFYGNQVSLILTQTRALASLPIWYLLGYLTCSSIKFLWNVYAVVTACMIFKSLQGLFYYVHILGGVKGPLEYVVEHLTSDFLSTALLAVIAFFVVYKTNRIVKVCGACACILMTYMFLLNDRRSALVGLGLAAMSIIVSLPRNAWRRIWPHATLAALAMSAFLAVTWQSRGAIGFAARTIRSLSDPNESSAGYRRIENANLLSAIEKEPLTGIGFGRRFDLVFPMPDISGIYSEFDLIPHNTLLFLWTFAGPLGIAAFGTFIALAIGMCSRSMRFAKNRETAVLAALSMAVVVKSLAYVFADLGLREVRLLSFVGLIVGASLRIFDQEKEEQNLRPVGSLTGGFIL